MSVLTYGSAIWPDALELQEACRRIAPVYRLSALRVASAYRTISEDAVDAWLNHEHGEVDYYLTQMLAGRGCFGAYLYKFKYEDSPKYPTCLGVDEEAEHVFLICPRFSEARSSWEATHGRQTLPENLMEVLLSSQAAWEAARNFATTVMKELRNEERKRKSAE
ncbi:uncharacterized protein LOC107039704 [Diachasma alloeum]|uniref:uncharacterized protein LOC107039704 n=1 Tax=Diachasma alloeum TaxID=454923 RepID=UPI00073816A9|nr:uncharacterized protein LOC107039704 [Diachasma alloeum]